MARRKGGKLIWNLEFGIWNGTTKAELLLRTLNAEFPVANSKF